MATFIVSVIAVILTAAVLLIQWQNQKERRHGEIIQLKSQMLATLSAHRRRSASFLIQAETIRIQVQRLPDSDGKTKVSERIPQLMALLKESKDRSDKIRKSIEELETQGLNRSARFLKLQSLGSEIAKMEAKSREIEDGLIATLAIIQSKLPP
jgi:hypothetical protein